MNSFNEVRRARNEMSARAGHDIRTLIASINSRWPGEASRALDPGTKAEQCDATEPGLHGFTNGESSAPAR